MTYHTLHRLSPGTRRLLTVVAGVCLIGVALWSGHKLAFGNEAVPAAAIPGEPDATFSAPDLEFFETRVRPLLVQHCYECHSATAQKGNLRLDARSLILQGGDSGPAVVARDPAQSELIRAISYDPEGYQMPPNGKLSDEAIATLTDWVTRGAPWPAEAVPAAGSTAASADAISPERLNHWSYRPIVRTAPPVVHDGAWLREPIDAYVLGALEAAGLNHSAEAPKATLLRRVTLELTGLPPTPEELAEFLADDSPDAYERVLDRLLASPQYGERVARHWLDLVRFSETAGHEFDYEIKHATPYRDYVVRAMNDDLPYDQFVREHIAGDLLPTPRRDVATGRDESTIATAFWWFGQGKHSPVDLRAEECELIDNQLDVFGKAFLAMTVACARCHDHKFDPIAARDYYALAGYLQSSHRTWAEVGSREARTALQARLTPQRVALEDAARASLAERLSRLAALWQQPGGPAEPVLNHLVASANAPITSPLGAWSRLMFAQQDPAKWAAVQQELATTLAHSAHDVAHARSEIIDYSPAGTATAARWLPEGDAWQPAHGTDSRFTWLPALSERLSTESISVRPPWVVGSTPLIPSYSGTLRSPTFVIEKPYLDIRVRRFGGAPHDGRPIKSGQWHTVISGFHFVQNPLYGHLSISIPPDGQWIWLRQDLTKFIGSRAYLELEDPADGSVEIAAVYGTSGPRPEPLEGTLLLAALARPQVANPRDAAEAVARVLLELAGRVAARQELSDEQWRLLSWLEQQPWWLMRLGPPGEVDGTRQRLEALAALAREWPSVELSVAMTAGSPIDEAVLVRGNPAKPGPIAPRAVPYVLQCSLAVAEGREAPARDAAAPAAGEGSTRLDLAHHLTQPRHPLVPRVMVNRLWHHAFGRGLVATVDDFGRMGQAPSHPALLDALALDLVDADWSLKHVQRRLYTSATYRQTSHLGDAATETRDPENLLWHRMSTQRLEGEAIRDSLLALSGRLDERMGGPSVLPYLTPFMEGRGRPGVSGPLDGEGRRSLYINVRRNFLSPFFLAFDFPTPASTMGRRASSNVPAQALTMMNNPFVLEQAGRWADSTNDGASPAERIERLYVSAFARRPTPSEVQAALDFLAASPDQSGWHDLAHVLINSKEFVFID